MEWTHILIEYFTQLATNSFFSSLGGYDVKETYLGLCRMKGCWNKIGGLPHLREHSQMIYSAQSSESTESILLLIKKLFWFQINIEYRSRAIKLRIFCIQSVKIYQRTDLHIKCSFIEFAHYLLCSIELDEFSDVICSIDFFLFWFIVFAHCARH